MNPETLSLIKTKIRNLHAQSKVITNTVNSENPLVLIDTLLHNAGATDCANSHKEAVQQLDEIRRALNALAVYTEWIANEVNLIIEGASISEVTDELVGKD